ncbi:MAG: CidA/LrgA family protein [Alicyclobacillus sp.]|nr:CidA/LrgA family protein [Alicyclobacillus sp.]MCL6516110.1 CidA/LrgA family protein [Alicyclobacillus sp.]
MIQVAALWAFAWVCNWVSAHLHLPIPGSILGCAVLFMLLATGVVKVSWVEAGADWLLAYLLLFFIPPAVGVMQYPSLFLRDGWRLLLVILASTILVMAVTGWTTDWISRRNVRARGGGRDRRNPRMDGLRRSDSGPTNPVGDGGHSDDGRFAG